MHISNYHTRTNVELCECHKFDIFAILSLRITVNNYVSKT